MFCHEGPLGLLLLCRASELKEALKGLGLSTTGSRKQLEERLMRHYESIQEDQNSDLAELVSVMQMWRQQDGSMCTWRTWHSS